MQELPFEQTISRLKAVDMSSNIGKIIALLMLTFLFMSKLVDMTKLFNLLICQEKLKQITISSRLSLVEEKELSSLMIGHS